jgi:uncharacterized cupin superfamily protein
MEQTVMQTGKVFKVFPDGPPGHGLKPISVMDQSNIISGVGTEIGTFDYVDPTRQFMVGIWESTPCVEYIPFYPCDEFCLILKGGIRITQKDGTENYFGEGEGFMVLRGTECHYAMTETTKKYSIMFENKLLVK